MPVPSTQSPAKPETAVLAFSRSSLNGTLILCISSTHLARSPKQERTTHGQYLLVYDNGAQETLPGHLGKRTTSRLILPRAAPVGFLSSPVLPAAFSA